MSVAPRGSGDGRTRLLFVATPVPEDQPTPIQDLARPSGAPPGTQAALPAQIEPPPADDPGAVILSADHPLSRQAFARQV